jgi:hypothetical protein
MRKFLSFISKAIAAIFAILFVISAVLAILLVNIERKLFDANLYKGALANQQVYARLPEIAGNLLVTSLFYNPCADNPLLCEDVPDALRSCYIQKLGEERYITLASGKEKPTEAEMQSIQPCIAQYGTETTAPTGGAENAGGPPSFIKNLKPKDIASIISIIMPPAEIQKMIESVLDQTFAFLNGNISQAKLSLTKLKEDLTGKPGQDAINYLINTQSPCTPEQLAAMLGGGGEDGMVLCAPPPDIIAMILPELQNQLKSAVAQIPDEVIILPPQDQPELTNAGPFGNDPVTTIRTVRFWLRLSPLLPLGLLLLVTLFGVRSLKGWMRWWGIPFFFVGLIALVPGIALLPVANWAWANLAMPRIPSIISGDIVSLGRSLVAYIVNKLAEPIVLQAAILMVIGLAVWICSYFINSKSKGTDWVETQGVTSI